MRQGYLRFAVERATDRPPYELRLELDGVLITWILPDEIRPDITTNAQWALPSEDEPLELLDNPEPWDFGTYLPLPCPEGSHEQTMREQLKSGEAILRFEGQQLTGTWHLKKIRHVWWLQQIPDGGA